MRDLPRSLCLEDPLDSRQNLVRAGLRCPVEPPGTKIFRKSLKNLQLRGQNMGILMSKALYSSFGPLDSHVLTSNLKIL